MYIFSLFFFEFLKIINLILFSNDILNKNAFPLKKKKIK